MSHRESDGRCRGFRARSRTEIRRKVFKGHLVCFGDEVARSGIALALVIAVILVLAVFATSLRLLSHGAYVEVSMLDEHLRATAVAEAGHSAITARLLATPWALRWFRKDPDIQFDVPAVDGTYEYVLRDTPKPASFSGRVEQAVFGEAYQADLFIRATCGHCTVAVFWRLILIDNSLEGLVRVVPVMVTFAPDHTPPTRGGMDELSDSVNTLIGQRSQNTPDFQGIAGPLAQAATAPQIASALSANPGGPVVDAISPQSGQPLVPNSTRIDSSRSSRPIPTPVPFLPPSVTPSSTGSSAAVIPLSGSTGSLSGASAVIPLSGSTGSLTPIQILQSLGLINPSWPGGGTGAATGTAQSSASAGTGTGTSTTAATAQTSASNTAGGASSFPSSGRRPLPTFPTPGGSTSAATPTPAAGASTSVPTIRSMEQVDASGNTVGPTLYQNPDDPSRWVTFGNLPASAQQALRQQGIYQ